MRLRVVDARWCIGSLLFTVQNINVSLWIRRVFDGVRKVYFHPTYNNLGVRITSTLGNSVFIPAMTAVTSLKLSEQTNASYSLTNFTAESNGIVESAHRAVVEICEVIREVVSEVIWTVEGPLRVNYSPAYNSRIFFIARIYTPFLCTG